MGTLFNIAGPCNAAKHYMLPAMARLPVIIKPLTLIGAAFDSTMRNLADRRIERLAAPMEGGAA